MDTLDQALTRLERLNRRQSQIVEMRFFAAPAERDARNLYQESLDDWRELRRRSPLDRQGLDEQRAVEAALSIGARTP